MTDMEKAEFIRCPICGNKTRDKIREDTILKNFPLFCPKCKSECLIDILYLCYVPSRLRGWVSSFFEEVNRPGNRSPAHQNTQ